MSREQLLILGALIAISAASPITRRVPQAAGDLPLRRALAGLTWQSIARFNVCAAYEAADCPAAGFPR
jgi:hypothetical protein